MNEHSPYAPPASDVAVVSDRKGAAWKAVSLGLLVDIGGTMLTGIVIAMVAFVLNGA